MLTKDDLRTLAERCRDRACHAGFSPLREILLEVADQYELDARLVAASLQAVLESKRLIAEADKLIVPLKQRLSGDGALLGRREDRAETHVFFG